MLSYLGGDKTSTMDALAQLYGFGLEIYQLDEAGKLRLVHQFAGPPSALDPVRLVHVGLEEGGPLNHFERLEVNPEHITAAQILEEAIPERDEASGYVVNLPLGTAREFHQTLQEFQEWINARQEIYEEALEQGLDEEEATQAANQVDEIAAIIEEMGKELKAVEQKAKQTLRQKKAVPSLPQAKPVKKAEEALPQKETSVLSLTEVEKKEVVAQQRQILQKAHDKIKTAVTLKGKISKAWHRFLEWWDEPLPANEFYETVKTTANKGAAAHDECMEASAQEHPLFTAFAQSVADVEGLNPIYLPETKGQAVLFGITFFKKEPGKRGATKLKGNTKSRQVVDAENKAPYHSQSMRKHLEKTYAKSKVESTTLPMPDQKNVRLAGTRHPQTGVVFDQRGFPIFDDVAKFDTRIGYKTALINNPRAHKIEATKILGQQIREGKVSPDLFTSQQLKEIYAGKERIMGLTWHHHQDVGRMQLISRDLHIKTGHAGGMNVWPITKDRRK